MHSVENIILQSDYSKCAYILWRVKKTGINSTQLLLSPMALNTALAVSADQSHSINRKVGKESHIQFKISQLLCPHFFHFICVTCKQAIR